MMMMLPPYVVIMIKGYTMGMTPPAEKRRRGQRLLVACCYDHY